MNEPQTLFDYAPTQGAARRTDPQTSVDAARSMTGDVLCHQQELVLRALGHIDCTSYEIWLRLQDEPSRPPENVISRRLTDLREAGMLELTGQTRPGRSNRQQQVNRITPKGRSWMAERWAS